MKKEEKRTGKRMETLVLLSVLALLLFLPTEASATMVSIGEVAVSPGGSATLPIMITDVTDCGVAAVQFSYDPSVVHVTEVKDSQFDLCDPVINNVTGDFEIGAIQLVSAGLNGNVRLANVTLKAVGIEGQWSYLNLTINELKTATPPIQNIPADVDSGKFTIQADSAAPILRIPYDGVVIPEDTDKVPLWGEMLTLDATDDSAISDMHVDLSTMGGSTVTVLSHIGNYTDGTLWCMFNLTNASVGTADWNGTAYRSYCLPVNATDIYGNSNVSLCVDVTVMKNGDVDIDGDVSYSDAMYLYKWKAGKPGFDTIHERVADVDGDSAVSYSDAMYLYKWKAGKPGFDVLH